MRQKSEACIMKKRPCPQPFEYEFNPDDVSSAGLPVDYDAPEGRKEYTNLAPVLETILKRFNINAQPRIMELAKAWPKLFPPEIAGITRPVKWEAPTLYVEVDGSTKLFELRRFKLRAMEKTVREFAAPDYDVQHIHLVPGVALKG